MTTSASATCHANINTQLLTTPPPTHLDIHNDGLHTDQRARRPPRHGKPAKLIQMMPSRISPGGKKAPQSTPHPANPETHPHTLHTSTTSPAPPAPVPAHPCNRNGDSYSPTSDIQRDGLKPCNGDAVSKQE
ncbi:hypothetical protein D9611_001771 [Ephemerocybe angulata]|uniref:Uncharacterized protein n=1 Tax=Ephemerocybe angulata TaxID=980116 RepID=A0A8H5FMM2_9AGAR|nr:hypothetical protein D9611_001771 [Tulosesus angulatus]